MAYISPQLILSRYKSILRRRNILIEIDYYCGIGRTNYVQWHIFTSIIGWWNTSRNSILISGLEHWMIESRPISVWSRSMTIVCCCCKHWTTGHPIANLNQHRGVVSHEYRNGKNLQKCEQWIFALALCLLKIYIK